MKPSMKKKADQLGMNPSSAQVRITRDILFKFVEEAGHACFHCGEPLTRETFSIEHKVPWLDSEDPVGLFFDLDNIAFSHLGCNSRAARKPHKKYATRKEYVDAKNKRNYTPEKRRERYLRLGT